MIDSIIDFLSGLFGNNPVEVPDVDADVDTSVDTDTTDVDDTNENSLGIVTDVATGGSTVVTGNSDVDTLLTKGIDTESTSTDNTVDQTQSKNKYRDLHTSFGAALGCNICSCKCYSGGDSSDSICTCGHAKWQHLWG